MAEVIDPPADPKDPPADPKTPNPPPKEDTAKLLADLHKEKTARRELEEKLKTQEMEKLKAAENWKAVAEAKEKEAQEANDKLAARESADQERQKLSAFREAAVRAGIRKEAMSDLKMVSLDGLIVDPSTDNVIGVDKAIEALKLQRPHWFSGSKAPGINLNQPSVVEGEKVSFDELKKLEIDAKKTGDYSKYTAATIRMKQQLAAQ